MDTIPDSMLDDVFDQALAVTRDVVCPMHDADAALARLRILVQDLGADHEAVIRFCDVNRNLPGLARAAVYVRGQHRRTRRRAA